MRKKDISNTYVIPSQGFRRQWTPHILSPVSPLFANEDERQCFDRFRAYLAVASTDLFDTQFWSHLALQISHSEPAVRQGIVALGKLQRETEISNALGNPALRGDYDKKHEQSLALYGKTIKSVRGLLSRAEDPNKLDRGTLNAILTACIILISYDNLSGNYLTAQVHLKSGLSILGGESGGPHRASIPLPSPTEPDLSPAKATNRAPNHYHSTFSKARLAAGVAPAIHHVFSRLDLQGMTFSNTRGPRQFDTLPLDYLALEEPHEVPATFSQDTWARDASVHLVNQARWLLKITEYLFSPILVTAKERDPTFDYEGAVQFALRRKKQCDENMLAWKAAFDRTLAAADATHEAAGQRRSRKDEVRRRLLLIWYHTGLLVLQGLHFGRERSWDACQASLELCVDESEIVARESEELLSQQPLTDSEPLVNSKPTIRPIHNVPYVSLETGILFPLFLLACRCRAPKLRRRAISILDASPRQEGIWWVLPIAIALGNRH